VVDLVDTQADGGQRGAAIGPDRRGEPQVGALADVPVVPRSGPGQREHPAVRCHPGGAGGGHRAHDQRGGHVHPDVGVHQLGIGRGDHPVARARVGDLVGAVRGGPPRVRVGRAHLGEPAPQLGDHPGVLGDPAPQSGADGVLEHRVVLHRQSQPDRVLTGVDRVESHLLRCQVVGLGHRVGLAGPVQRDAVAPGQPPAAYRLGAADQHHVVLAGLDGGGRPVEQHRRGVAADAGAHQVFR